MRADILIYGANGYTGELIARRAVEHGLRPILAGRNADAVGALARELALPHRAFAADAAGEGTLDGARVVLNCAGPFARTAVPLAEVCLRAGACYLDVTGEVEVFEALAALDEAARRAGVMLLPGVGFDVVPSDCLAAHLKRRLPTATHLTLAFRPSGGVSRGTATTLVENAHRGGLVRRQGVLTRVPLGGAARRVDFGRGERVAVRIPWGDVATAWHSTGIPNIEVYVAAPAVARWALRLARPLAPLLARPAVKRVLRSYVRRGPPGPDAGQRARGHTVIWGEVRDQEGRRAVSRLQGPEGYEFTVRTALLCLEQAWKGQAPPGFQTPARAFGPDFVLAVDGVRREDP
jgi:short subunit dehydrogenase-like uncharacterized protein